MDMTKMVNIGYALGVVGVATVLIWIGAFKFTPTEAKAIYPLVSTSPLMKWMYSLSSAQAVSNLIGAVELLIGVLLALSFRWSIAGVIGGTMGALTFIITLSFLITSPNGFEKIDGMWLPDAFILKDITALGICLMVIGKNWK